MVGVFGTALQDFTLTAGYSNDERLSTNFEQPNN